MTGPKPRHIADRFWDKVKKGPACWWWTGYISTSGYGTIGAGGKRGEKLYAHRVSVILDGREIPGGMFVDHICRNRVCVRPDHLRVVTPKQNALENNSSPCAIHAAKTHCTRGHALSDDNLVGMGGNTRKAGRSCKTCARDHARRYLARLTPEQRKKKSAVDRRWKEKNKEKLRAYFAQRYESKKREAKP